MIKKQEEMHYLNTPQAYEDLSPTEKEALAYWIEHAMCSAARYTQRTSYGIKHDFEREGFYISNGQFKGAMLRAGYQPKDATELNWIFKIKPLGLSPKGSDRLSFYIGKEEPQHQRYADLLAQIQKEYEQQAEARKKEKRETSEKA